jgi:transcriptional regulator with XRE-family HTH domain
MTEALKVGVSAKEEPSTTSNVAGLGKRALFLRKQKGLSLDELAAASGLTKGYLSKVERGLSVPSISTALKLAKCFGLSVGQLLGDEEIDEAITVVRKNQRRPFMREGTPLDSNYESMAGHKTLRAMEPFIMKPPQEFDDDRMFQHVGEEFMFVLQGTVELEFPARRVRLEEGDSIYFDAHIQHRTRCIGAGAGAEVLVIVHSPVES